MSPDKQPLSEELVGAAKALGYTDEEIVAGTALDEPAPAEPPAQEPTPPAVIDDSPEPPNVFEDLAEEEEVPPPSEVHPSAPAGTVKDKDLEAGRKEHGEFFIGMWGDKPNFGCPYCSYSTLNNGEVELHVLSMIDSGNLEHMAALQLQQEGA